MLRVARGLEHCCSRWHSCRQNAGVSQFCSRQARPNRPRDFTGFAYSSDRLIRPGLAVRSSSSVGGSPTNDARNETSWMQRLKTSSDRGGSMGDQIRELKQVMAQHGGTAFADPGLLSAEKAHIFPPVEARSLSGGAVIVQSQASNASVTLVLLAFRSFADDQLSTWRSSFAEAVGKDPRSQVFDISVNETFAAQALSGFVQRFQRGNVDASLHEHHLALNGAPEETMERIMPSKNRLFGYAMLLDRHGRVRFRVAGKASPGSKEAFAAAARQLLLDDSTSGISKASSGNLKNPKQSSYKGGKV